jgi:hypothetical protein
MKHASQQFFQDKSHLMYDLRSEKARGKARNSRKLTKLLNRSSYSTGSSVDNRDNPRVRNTRVRNTRVRNTLQQTSDRTRSDRTRSDRARADRHSAESFGDIAKHDNCDDAWINIADADDILLHLGPCHA